MKLTNTYIATSLIGLLSAPAMSQSIDYGSLEMMFDEPVTEGATGTPKRASETPINMTIVTAEEIRRSGARDIPEVLRRIAGVDVQRAGQMGAIVSIRGRNHDGQRLRVLINGRDTFRPYEGTTVWNSLPVSMEEIRQIEVVRGPATALYGANAVTGVINIITFSPLYDQENTFTGRIGSTGIREMSGVSTLKLGGVGGIRLSGGYAEMDRADAILSPAQELARESEPDMLRFSGDGLFNVTDTLKLGVEGTYFEGDVMNQNWYGIAETGASKDWSLKVSLALDSDIGRWTLQAFQNKYDESRTNVIDLGDGPFSFSQDIAAKTEYIDLNNAQSLGSTNIRLTVGYRKDEVDQFGGSLADGTGQVGYKTLFFSGLADHTFSDSVSLAVSVRYDNLDAFRTADELGPIVPFTNADFGSFNELSVNAGLTVKASELDTIKLMYARGFQAPNLFELGGQIVPTDVFPGGVGVGGQPNLEPAISTQFELQYLRSIDNISGSVSASLFYRKDKKIIGRAISGSLLPTLAGGFYMGSDNVANAETWGFELDIKGTVNETVSWGLQYSFADTSDELGQNVYTPISAFYPIVQDYYDGRSSKHIFTAKLGYQAERFSVDALIQYKSGFSSYSDFTNIPGFLDPFRDVDGVVVGNLAAHYQLTDTIKLSLVGEGLFDKLRQDTVDVSLAAERRIWAGLSFSF